MGGTCLTMFGSNHDHTIGSGRSINSSSRSILQNLNTLYITWGQKIDVGTYLHTIHYIQRIGGTVNRRDTTYANGCISIWSTVLSNNHYSRCRPLQALCNVCRSFS